MFLNVWRNYMVFMYIIIRFFFLRSSGSNDWNHVDPRCVFS